jgi:hypothetical protein
MLMNLLLGEEGDMGSWRWPSVVVFGIIVAAIVMLFWLSDDADTHTLLLGWAEKVIMFAIGAGAGGALGYARSRGIGTLPGRSRNAGLVEAIRRRRRS